MQEAIYLWNKHLYDIWWRVWSQNLARVNSKEHNNIYGGLKLWVSEKVTFSCLWWWCREAVNFHEDCLIHTITHTFLLLLRPVNVQRLKQPPHPQDSLPATLVAGLLILCLSYLDNNQISLFPPVANLALSTWTCQHIPCKVEPIVLGCYGSEKFKPAVLTRLFRTKDPALINLSFSDSKQHFITIFQVMDYVSIALKTLTVWETAYC